MTINTKHHPWLGQRYLVWEKRDKNETLINIESEEIDKQKENKY